MNHTLQVPRQGSFPSSALVESRLKTQVESPQKRAFTPVRVSPHLHSPWIHAKRLGDVCLAGLLLLLLSPLFLLIGLLIRLSSPGSAFYRQERKGQHGRFFQVFKFRTMEQDAHQKRQKMFHHNEIDGIIFKMKRDPRVTLLGRWLRMTSLDELPQLINVLKGEMSLVGPRPFSVEVFNRGPENDPLYTQWIQARQKVTPGITGLWQVNGRNELSFEELMLHDLHYVSQWSPWLDLQILFKTLPAVFSRKGAY